MKRKRGRPKGEPTASISARVSVKYKRALLKAARRWHMTVGQMIVESLRKHCPHAREIDG